MHNNMYIYIHVNTYSHIQILIHIYAKIYIHTYIHTHTYIHEYIYTYIHTYTHTYPMTPKIIMAITKELHSCFANITCGALDFTW